MNMCYDYQGLSELVSTKESLLPICDKAYHMNKTNVKIGEEMKVLRNYAFVPYL